MIKDMDILQFVLNLEYLEAELLFRISAFLAYVVRLIRNESYRCLRKSGSNRA
jgi:hypothetical protein